MTESRKITKYNILYNFLLRADSNKIIQTYYHLFGPLFYRMNENNNYLNLGYSEENTNLPLTIKKSQEKMVKKVTEIFDKNGRWLDVGSGTGAPACYLAKLYPNIKVEGINIVKDQIKKSTKLSISKRCENQVNFIFGDALDIPYPENFFQNIYAIESAFHFEDKLKFIKESHRVLSHSGKISIADIVIRKEYLKWSDWYKIFIAKHGLATKEFYDKDKWHETLEQNNFNNIETEDITINVLRLFPKWIKLIQSNKNKLIGLYPKTFLTMFVKCLEYAYNKYDKCPFGYIIIKAEKS